MKKTILLFGLLWTMMLSIAQTNQPQDIPNLDIPELTNLNKSSWSCLFNGESLENWHVKCKPSDQEKEYFKIIDKTIEANSVGDTIHDYMWLVSNQSFADFVLVLDFKLYNGQTGNTGVQFRSKYNDSIFWLDGPQVDICVAPLWRTGMIWDETRNNKRWIYPDLPSDKWVDKTMAPANLQVKTSDKEQSWGEWNQMIIIAKGTQIKVYVNGEKVSDYNGEGVLNSANHQGFKVGMQGQFALQIHNKDQVKVAYKNIWVAEF